MALKSIYHDIKNSLIGAQLVNDNVKKNININNKILNENVQTIDYYLTWTLNLINSYLDFC